MVVENSLLCRRFALQPLIFGMATLPSHTSHITILNDAAGFCQVLALATELQCKTSETSTLHLQSVPSKPVQTQPRLDTLPPNRAVALRGTSDDKMSASSNKHKTVPLPFCSSFFFSLTSVLLHCGCFRKACEALCAVGPIHCLFNVLIHINQSNQELESPGWQQT